MAQSSFPHVVIEHLTPDLDGGRHPIKRRVGDTVHVGVDIYKDGHDLVDARIAYRRKGEDTWRHAPLSYVFDDDRWFGKFTLGQPGRWQYTVEGWPDPFDTWRSDLKKRIAAEQDVRSELLEGAALVQARVKAARAEQKARLVEAAKLLADATASVDARIAGAFSEHLREDMSGPHDEASLTRYPIREVIADRDLAVFGSWYELFPRSQSQEFGKHGTFADTEARLASLAAQGFDVIYLPPIHPIGRTKRKGKNNAPAAEPGDVGSPWAIGAKEGGHTAVHPDLGTLADFERLVTSANELGMEIALDFALQCSPDHPWIHEHPEWFFVRPDGTLRYAENPPKKYEDIYPLNFWCEDRQALWNACRDALLFWIARGVRIFRVDNPHTKPFAFWEWVIEEVQRDHPDVIFLAEAFTRPKRMRALAKLGFTQSYTYFTWKNSPWELREYVEELAHSEMAEYYRPNFFANTPDILHEYLQKGGRAAFRIRLLLAGTLSPSYGIYSGFELCENVPVRPGSEEYLNSEKYEIRVRDMNAPGNIRADVARLNRIRRENPALHQLSNVRFLDTDFDGILAFHKSVSGNDLIVVVNTDPFEAHETMLDVPLSALGFGPEKTFTVEDLLTGERYEWHGPRAYVKLDPADKIGHVLRVVR
ncbi:MAG: alpha-1,4-glucan--maltose-1-phosphate maltosyltransferase [Myxococcales bacterium]|nr:alpha-1,4-glucan--maltose-1-phosphate maltosyltransferase [Myxococcales bacterium]MCB9582375.1 alpha-1,4-glucan--maltose-1-phosphate maltosyltransferase [Polyangiaceae bacterium]